MTESIRIATVADLIGSIPALLGFVPRESLVVVAQRGPSVLFTARHDITAVGSGQRDAEALSEIIARNGTDRVLLVAISTGPTIGALTQIAGHLEGHGIEVDRLVHVTTCDHAAEYIDYVTGETGTTTDFRDSIATATMAVEQGTVIRASRQEFGAMFATTAEAAPVDPATIDPARVAQDILSAVDGNTDPGPELAAQFGALIADVKIRDAMLRLGIDRAGTAAVVMARTAAHVRSDSRARVLALAMFFFYVAGNGAAASMAQEAVTDEALTPTTFMRLLDTALQSGMHPEMLRELIPTQQEASTYLGMQFPI